MIAMNARTCFLATREAARALRGRGGRIVNVAARPALVPTAGLVAYAASKAAVVAITQGAAAELVRTYAPVLRRVIRVRLADGRLRRRVGGTGRAGVLGGIGGVEARIDPPHKWRDAPVARHPHERRTEFERQCSFKRPLVERLERKGCIAAAGQARRTRAPAACRVPVPSLVRSITSTGPPSSATSSRVLAP